MPHGTHVSVLLEESVAALALEPDGTYVDATFGRGGHSRAILARLSARGRVVAIEHKQGASVTTQEDNGNAAQQSEQAE